MRILLKILAPPFVLLFTLLVAVCHFLLVVGEWFFAVAGTLLAIMGVIMLVRGSGVYNGVGLLVMGFLVSPFGLPAAALWIVERLEDLNDNLKGFIVG